MKISKWAPVPETGGWAFIQRAPWGGTYLTLDPSPNRIVLPGEAPYPVPWSTGYPFPQESSALHEAERRFGIQPEAWKPVLPPRRQEWIPELDRPFSPPRIVKFAVAGDLHWRILDLPSGCLVRCDDLEIPVPGDQPDGASLEGIIEYARQAQNIAPSDWRPVTDDDEPGDLVRILEAVYAGGESFSHCCMIAAWLYDHIVWDERGFRASVSQRGAAAVVNESGIFNGMHDPHPITEHPHGAGPDVENSYIVWYHGLFAAQDVPDDPFYATIPESLKATGLVSRIHGR